MPHHHIAHLITPPLQEDRQLLDSPALLSMSSLYSDAAASVSAFLTQRTSLKSLLLSPTSSSTPVPPSHAKLCALITETLRYTPVLDLLIQRCHLSRLHPALTRPLLLVLLYDLLFSPSKAIEGGGHLKRLLLAQRTPIHSTLARLYIAHAASTPLGLLPPALRPRPPHPRYVRVNLLLTSLSAAVSALQAQGYSYVPHPPHPSPLSFYPDPHVPSLLVFPPSTPFHSNPLYRSSQLILQDKASTFPPLCLNPSPHDVVVDACAAPGNKTSQLMAMMKETGTVGAGGGGRQVGGVDAFEVDFKRFGLLVDMLESKGATVRVEDKEGGDARLEGEKAAKKGKGTGGVEAVGLGSRVTVHHASFLSLDGTRGVGARVTKLLLDPTCSGSGMLHSIDAYYKQKNREDDQDSIAAERQTRKKLTRQGHQPPRTQHHAQRKRAREGEEAKEGGGADEAAVQDEDAQAALENQPTLQPQLAELANFQLSLLLHAFSLPSLTHLVYSTCSVHVEENEAVIARALAERGRALGWEVEGGLLPSWPRRGLPTTPLSADECSRMIRCDPDEDLTNGFFVCGLRKGGGERTAESGRDSGSRASGDREEMIAVNGEGGQSKKRKKQKKRGKKKAQTETNASAIVEGEPDL